MTGFGYGQEMSDGSKQPDLSKNNSFRQTEDDSSRHKKNPTEIRYFLDKSSFKANPQRSSFRLAKLAKYLYS